MLTSGTGLLLVCQEYLTISSTPNPHVGDYKRTDRAVTTYRLPRQTVEKVCKNGNLQPRHHVYTIDCYSNPDSVHDSSP